MFVKEFAEEGVEVVGGGGEVKPGGAEGLLDRGVEVGHARDGGRFVDESAAEDADGGGRHGDFYGVVDVYRLDKSTACWVGLWELPEMTAQPSGSAKCVSIGP